MLLFCLRLLPVTCHACRDIANFLRIYKDDLDPWSIGDFLSEPDLNGVSTCSTECMDLQNWDFLWKWACCRSSCSQLCTFSGANEVEET